MPTDLITLPPSSAVKVVTGPSRPLGCNELLAKIWFSELGIYLWTLLFLYLETFSFLLWMIFPSTTICTQTNKILWLTISFSCFVFNPHHFQHLCCHSEWVLLLTVCLPSHVGVQRNDFSASAEQEAVAHYSPGKRLQVPNNLNASLCWHYYIASGLGFTLSTFPHCIHLNLILVYFTQKTRGVS